MWLHISDAQLSVIVVVVVVGRGSKEGAGRYNNDNNDNKYNKDNNNKDGEDSLRKVEMITSEWPTCLIQYAPEETIEMLMWEDQESFTGGRTLMTWTAGGGMSHQT